MDRLKRVISLCLLLAIFASVALFAASCGADSEEEARLEEYELKLADLVNQKQALLKERDNLTPNMDKELGNTSYMSFIFTEIDSALYTDVYPVMSEGEIKLIGVMALSVDELPGGEGNITLAEYSELIGLGWGSALYWNGEGELSDFIAAMSELLPALDIDLPKSLMFKKDTYLSSYDALLSESGIENVIQSGDDDMKIVESTEPLGVWHPGYIGWRWVGTSTRLKSTIISDGGYALFEIAFNNAEEHTHTSYFPIEGEVNDSNRTRVFQNMMTNFINSIEAGEIEVLNIEDTRAKVEAYYVARAEREAANEIRREQIKDEIQEIERQMTLLYDEYH